MSYQGSPIRSAYGQDEYEVDEENEEYMDDNRDFGDQDESDEGKYIYIFKNFPFIRKNNYLNLKTY